MSMLCKSMNSFLYDRDLRYERVKFSCYVCKLKEESANFDEFVASLY